jgi:hypothetical protein
MLSLRDWQTGWEPATILDCGGKRSATPLSNLRDGSDFPTSQARPKAPSPLRSAGAVQDAAGKTGAWRKSGRSLESGGSGAAAPAYQDAPLEMSRRGDGL